jgi:hypothetical protein
MARHAETNANNKRPIFNLNCPGDSIRRPSTLKRRSRGDARFIREKRIRKNPFAIRLATLFVDSTGLAA